MFARYSDYAMSKSNPMFSVFTEFFDDLFLVKSEGQALAPADKHHNTGAYYTTSDDKSMTLVIDLPGIPPEAVTVHTNDSQVIVVHKKSGDSKKFTGKYTIDPKYTLSAARASMEHGQLRISIPARQASALVQVPIEVK